MMHDPELDHDWHKRAELAIAMLADGAAVDEVPRGDAYEGDVMGERMEDHLPSPSRNGVHEADNSARRDFHKTDRGHAERVIDRHGRDLRYCVPMKAWFAWDSRRWAEDAMNEAAWRVKETQRSLLKSAMAEMQKLGDAGDDSERKAQLAALMGTIKDCLAWEAQRSINGTLDSMKSERGVPILPDAFDRDPMLLNCLNGTVDLRTGELQPHRREDFISKLCPVRYDAAAECPLWDRCLDRWMESRDRLKDYLQRVAGYAATGDVSEQCLWFFHGSGLNGKSTWLTTIRELLGDYALQGVPELLLQKKVESHPTERADLFGRRFVATIETDEGRRLAESFTKQLTGGENLRARRMKKDFIEIPPTWKIFLAANHKPAIKGTDTGVWRRIKLVPWSAIIAESERDRDLKNKLEREQPGILAWIVRGCQEWQRSGLQEPAEVTEATERYRGEQDTLAQFMDECCFKSDTAGVQIRSSQLLEAYEKWYGQTVSRNTFASLMGARGFWTEKDGDGCKVYRGLSLKP